MPDSDDYFSDDFVLDDSALALLDEEEQKYTLSTQAPTPIAPPIAAPPLKRQKTDNGWKPAGLGIRRTETLDDMDDLPEISVHGDGLYSLHSRHSAAPTRPIGVQPGGRGNITQVQPAQVPPPVQRRTVSSSSSSANASQQSRNVTYNRPPPLQRQPSSTALSRPSIHAPVPSQSSYRNVPHAQAVSDTAAADALRLQIEELRKDNERIQAALQDALSARFAKEGEVTILRKNIEKTAQDHSAQAAKLRLAKEEAEAKQVQIKKEAQEEIERVKTQYTFKRHEMETSTRKSQWSVRSKRTTTDAPPTPIDVPSQMRGWNVDARAASGSHIHETPKGPRIGSTFKDSPKTVRIRKPAFVESAKKPAKLPGFYNAFATSTPARKTKPKVDDGGVGRSGGKGKERASPFGVLSQFQSTGPAPPSPPSSPTRVKTAFDVEMPSDDGTTFGADDMYDHGPRDVEIVDENADEPMSEELDDIDSPNWREELHRIILTHVPESSTLVTFQTLMKAPSESSMPVESAEAYSKACTRTLEVLAANSYHIDWETALYTVATCLTDMSHLLNVANLIPSLTALLSLLTNLSYSLPSFSSFLLSPAGDSPPKLLIVLCDVVREHLSPLSATVKAGNADTVKALAEGVIGLMESLCWNIPNDLEPQLACIPRNPRVLSILLDPAQPQWLLCHSTKLLACFSTRPNLFRALLSYPDSEPPSGIKEFTKIPHIERLCSLLVDVSFPETDEAQAMQDSILAFFTMLAVSHADALTILVESLTLVPSLVLHLTQLAIPLREDDPEFMASPSRVASSIRAMSRTVVLLNYLVFGTQPTSNLRQKLHHAPHRAFNGLTYMFIVTLGALSYADPPEWVGDEGRAELEQLVEMARDLLDLVVEGPESDSVYAAYQIDAEDGSVTDDEEMEARLLEAN